MNIQLTKREVNLAMAALEHLFEAADDALNGPNKITFSDRVDFMKERDGAEQLSIRLAKVVQ